MRCFIDSLVSYTSIENNSRKRKEISDYKIQEIESFHVINRKTIVLDSGVLIYDTYMTPNIFVDNTWLD